MGRALERYKQSLRATVYARSLSLAAANRIDNLEDKRNERQFYALGHRPRNNRLSEMLRYRKSTPYALAEGIFDFFFKVKILIRPHCVINSTSYEPFVSIQLTRNPKEVSSLNQSNTTPGTCQKILASSTATSCKQFPRT